MAVKVCVCVSMWVCTDEYRGPTRVLDALELELQAVVSPLMGVLETKPGRSASAVSAVSVTAPSGAESAMQVLHITVPVFIRSSSCSSPRSRTH